LRALRALRLWETRFDVSQRGGAEVQYHLFPSLRDRSERINSTYVRPWSTRQRHCQAFGPS
jgi:hypothetical protein